MLPVPLGSRLSGIFRISGRPESSRPVEVDRGSDLLHPGSVGSLDDLLLDPLSLVNLPVRNSGLDSLLNGGSLGLLLGRLLGDRLLGLRDLGLGCSRSLGCCSLSGRSLRGIGLC